jgi:hypothetical protein
MKLTKALIIIAALFLVSCQSVGRFADVGMQKNTSTGTSPKPVLGKDTVLFVEHITEVSGERISGSIYHSSLFKYIDGPAYWWDEEKRTLKIDTNWTHYTFIEGTKVLYGDGEERYGEAGSGIATTLTSIFEVPYIATDGLEWNQLGQDGTLRIKYAGQNIILKPGIKMQRRQYQLHRDGTNFFEIITTEWFINHGFITPLKVTKTK